VLCALLLAGGEQDLGEFDQDIGPEMEHLIWDQSDAASPQLGSEMRSDVRPAHRVSTSRPSSMPEAGQVPARPWGRRDTFVAGVTCRPE
jgi:hypothetical protein